MKKPETGVYNIEGAYSYPNGRGAGIQKGGLEVLEEGIIIGLIQDIEGRAKDTKIVVGLYLSTRDIDPRIYLTKTYLSFGSSVLWGFDYKENMVGDCAIDFSLKGSFAEFVEFQDISERIHSQHKTGVPLDEIAYSMGRFSREYLQEIFFRENFNSLFEPQNGNGKGWLRFKRIGLADYS